MSGRRSVMTQDEYIAILLADCGYSSVSQRKGWIELRFGKKYADELTKAEKSRAIQLLKEEKELNADR